MQDFITAKEISRLLQISLKTVYQFMRMPISEGGLQSYKVSPGKTASRRVYRLDFEKWLEGRKDAEQLT